jgi:integrase
MNKLDTKLELNEIKQTRTGRTPRPVISFRDSAIDKISRATTAFGPKKYIGYNFDVSKGSSLKGLMLKFYKQSQKKSFVLSFWFNNRNDYYILGSYPNIRCKDVERICLDLAETHQDNRGFWLKNPNQTRADEKRLVEKPDTTITAGKSINEVIEDYCKGGFEKDTKFGKRTSKSCKIWFRYMAGYNKRKTLIDFEDDDSGSGVVKFVPNKRLRIIAPRDWQDLFRKFPPGKGIKKDREYYNRRKKHTYTIAASTNKAIYDTDLGKSLIEDLKTGDIEHWLKDVSSSTLKEKYLKVFITLWIWARKKGWLGTNPGECPISLETVYIKKELKKEDPYKDIAIEDPKILSIFWESCEELSQRFPWKAEMHQFLLLTTLRKTEAMKYKKEYIDWQKMTYLIPKGISKTRRINKVQPITPELEILFLNILDIGDRPGLEYYKMKDHLWLFGTTKWSASKYFSKEHKQSHKSHLGGDETFIPELRALMRSKANDPALLYAPKILRKSYITLSEKVHKGRSDITAETSRHENLGVLRKSYNKPGIETRRAWASKVSKHFNFVQRRSA